MQVAALVVWLSAQFPGRRVESRHARETRAQLFRVRERGVRRARELAISDRVFERHSAQGIIDLLENRDTIARMRRDPQRVWMEG